MKNRLAALLGVFVLLTVSGWAQSDSVADAAQQNQQKKASRVIDNENIGSVSADSSPAQDVTTASPDAEKDANEVAAKPERDQKAATPKEEVERQKEKEKNWLNSIEICKQKLENAQTDMQRDIWTENLASAEDGLSKTRKDLANAERELQESEQNQGTQPAPPADQAGNSPEQAGTGTAPQ